MISVDDKEIMMNVMMELLPLLIFLLIFLSSHLTPTNTTANTPFSLLHSYPHITQLSNILILNNYCDMKNIIFLISLVGEKVNNGKSIIGYTDGNDKNVIALYVKNRYNIKLGEQLQNKYSFQNGIHWEYETDNAYVDVHVDIIHKIE